MDNLAKTMEGWFKQLPSLPASAVDVLVNIAPWIALVFGILGVLSGLAGFGLLTAFSPLAMMGGVNGYGLGFIAAIGLIVSSVLELAAFPGLKARKMSGWNLLFWSEIVSVVASVVGLVTGGAGIVGSVIGALIGLYLLFQIKPKYK
ncbi:hypothetical protein HY024_00890 [Candidatus Curtissbacteria bacterium]|nr:hypothetical protein [Candidatus Curtissbacteria bacterium]